MKNASPDNASITIARKGIVVLILVAGILVVAPFLVPIGMGALIAVLLSPVMRFFGRFHFPKTVAAAFFTIALTALILLPMTLLTISGVRSGLEELRHFKTESANAIQGEPSDSVLDKMFSSAGVDKVFQKAARVVPVSAEELSDQLKGLLGSIAVRLREALSSFIGNVPGMLVSFSVFLFSLYFFLADGARFVLGIRRSTVFSQEDTERLLNVFSGLCRSVVLASLVGGLVQATLATIVSLSLGVKQFPLVFLVVLFTSFLPLVGSFPFIMGMGIYQASQGNSGAAWVFVGAAIFISSIDNIIRPLIIRGSSKLRLHPLLGLVSALGGLRLFGMAGIFLGPVLCGMFVAALELYLTRNTEQ